MVSRGQSAAAGMVAFRIPEGAVSLWAVLGASVHGPPVDRSRADQEGVRKEEADFRPPGVHYRLALVGVAERDTTRG